MQVTREDLDEYERRHHASAADLAGLQARVLQMILHGARASAFTRDHDIANASIDEFRTRVPVQSYDEHMPYVARMLAGEPNQLFDGSTNTFMHTSGTTSTPKLIPENSGMSKEQRALARIDDDYEVALFLREHPDLSFRARHLGDCGLWLPLVSPPSKLDEHGRLMGFVSGHVYDQLYRAAPSFYFTRPSWLRHMQGSVALYVLARLAVGEDIRLVNGPMYSVSELPRILNASTEEFLRDVRDGTLSREISPALAAELPALRPDPDRARLLAALAACDGGLWPHHVWPRVSVVRTFCQSGMALHGDFLRHAYRAKLRDMGLVSTEGRGYAYCLKTEALPLVMAAHRNFYELVDDAGRVHLLHEAEQGKTYRVVLTTPHGLYRYDSLDLVEVVDRLHGVPVIEGRGRFATSNLAGEKLLEVHVTETMRQVLGPDVGRVAGFLLMPHVPHEGRRGFYELAIEYQPPRPDADSLAGAVEEALGRVNRLGYYEFRFGTPALDRLRVTFLPTGWFRENFLEERGAQSKPPVFWTAARPKSWPPLAEE